jgi:hypothetical protein
VASNLAAPFLLAPAFPRKTLTPVVSISNPATIVMSSNIFDVVIVPYKVKPFAVKMTKDTLKCKIAG